MKAITWNGDYLTTFKKMVQVMEEGWDVDERTGRGTDGASPIVNPFIYGYNMSRLVVSGSSSHVKLHGVRIVNYSIERHTPSWVFMPDSAFTVATSAPDAKELEQLGFCNGVINELNLPFKYVLQNDCLCLAFDAKVQGNVVLVELASPRVKVSRVVPHDSVRRIQFSRKNPTDWIDIDENNKIILRDQ